MAFKRKTFILYGHSVAVSAVLYLALERPSLTVGKIIYRNYLGKFSK